MCASITLRNIYIIIHSARIKIKNIFQTNEFFYQNFPRVRKKEKTPGKIAERFLSFKAFTVLDKSLSISRRGFAFSTARFTIIRYKQVLYFQRLSGCERIKQNFIYFCAYCAFNRRFVQIKLFFVLFNRFFVFERRSFEIDDYLLFVIDK